MGCGERPMERKLIATFKHGKIGSPQFVARWFLAVIHQKVDFCHFPFLVAVLIFSLKRELVMNRCPNCNKRLIAMTDRTGHTEYRCLKCDKVDPIKTDLAKWADSPLAKSVSGP